jgi:hypothetical protein
MKSFTLSKSTAFPNDKDNKNSNFPNQYVRVKNVTKGEDVIKDNLSKSTALPNDKDNNNSNLPNQYARVKNVTKGEDLIKENTDHTYAFVDEFLEEVMKSSIIYEADEDVDYEYWSSNHIAHAKISIPDSPQNKFMNLLHLPEKYHISILDGGADTFVLGRR